MSARNPEALIDDDVLAELRGAMGPEAFADIAATFCDQVAAMTAAFSAAARAHDQRELARIAHELVGLAGTMGAPRLVVVAREAMRLNREDCSEAMQAVAATLEREAAATLEAFREIVPA